MPRSYLATDNDINLGPCCICEGTSDVTNIILLSRRCAVPGHGWGCLVCKLPNDGASAVLCDQCCEKHWAGEPLKFFCRGYPAEDGRMPFDQASERFDHDPEVDHNA